MTRRTSTRPRSQRRRSLVVIAIVIVAAFALGLALVPGVVAPKAPLDCPYGEVILNGVGQCLPPPTPR
jgi:hypothetical protein